MNPLAIAIIALSLATCLNVWHCTLLRRRIEQLERAESSRDMRLPYARLQVRQIAQEEAAAMALFLSKREGDGE